MRICQACDAVATGLTKCVRCGEEIPPLSWEKPAVPPVDVPARLRDEADELEQWLNGRAARFARLLAAAYEALPAGHPLLSRIEEAAK